MSACRSSRNGARFAFVSDVASHYAQAEDLTTAIRDALTNAGVDLDSITTTALAPVDEFHIRGRTATLEIAAALAVDKQAIHI